MNMHFPYFQQQNNHKNSFLKHDYWKNYFQNQNINLKTNCPYDIQISLSFLKSF